MKKTICGLAVMLLLGCATTAHPPLRLVGKWHRVAADDTIESVARSYGATPEEVAELNDLADNNALRAREEIFVPTADGSLPGTGAPPSKPKNAVAVKTQASINRPKTRSSAKSGADGKCVRQCLSWPTSGELVTLFGPNAGTGSEGVDISTPAGTPVQAAGPGTVIYAGERIKGYGKMILIRHDGDLITVYAHNAKVLVKEGDKVQMGQQIAEVGSSGAAGSPRLHFEVRLKQEPRNPLDYLPSRK